MATKPGANQKADSAKNPTSGVFITFEGGEGAGKSTHIRFLTEALKDHGCEVVHVREPGGTAIGEDLRGVVLNAKNTEMADETELFVYEAARAQIVSQVIRPALERGAVVLCDGFADSTVAYQAYGRGLDRAFVDAANRFATAGVWPDRTIVMTCGSAACGLERATHMGADRLELAGLDFHERVNKAFLDLAAEQPERVRLVDSSTPKAETAKNVFSQVSDLFPWIDDLLADESYFGHFNSVSLSREKMQAELKAKAASGEKGVADGEGAI